MSGTLPGKAKPQPSGFRKLELRFNEFVARPFSQACSADAVLAQIDDVTPCRGLDESPNPCHPLCADHFCSGYCQSVWRLQLERLRTHQHGHWHRCRSGRSCAMVPLIHKGRCIAAAKLVCAPNVKEARFKHLVVVLDAMMRNFVAQDAGALEAYEFDPTNVIRTDCEAYNGLPKFIREADGNPLIRRAAIYIENHLTDSDLDVQHVARALGVNKSYLSHVFATGVGERMRPFIRRQRIERAQQLLVTTDWQIKRIAQETGHLNANWFSQIFRDVTGVTPNRYRARFQRSIA